MARAHWALPGNTCDLAELNERAASDVFSINGHFTPVAALGSLESKPDNDRHAGMSQKCQKGGTLAWHDTNEAAKEVTALCMTVLRCRSAYGCACLCPTDSEGQNAMQ
jgi:hypothetical protein